MRPLSKNLASSQVQRAIKSRRRISSTWNGSISKPSPQAPHKHRFRRFGVRKESSERSHKLVFVRKSALSFSWNDQFCSISKTKNTHRQQQQPRQQTTRRTRRSAPGTQSRALRGSGRAGRRSARRCPRRTPRSRRRRSPPTGLPRRGTAAGTGPRRRPSRRRTWPRTASRRPAWRCGSCGSGAPWW